MPISEPQLETWANAPSSGKIQTTHEQIRKALEQSNALRDKAFDIYLQGSYANSTNIRIDSDVDIIIELRSTFSHNISTLPLDQQQLFHKNFSTATYHWSEFRLDVINALSDYFGSEWVFPGKKSIKLYGNDTRVDADIVPCQSHRKYESFSSWNGNDYVEGIKFWIQDGTNKEITNYPKVHIKNGEEKNKEPRTNQMYKDSVRIVKNMRRRLVENSGFDPKIAPSYFIECAIYNAPDYIFQTNYQGAIGNVFDFILNRCDSSKLLTVSHQHLLFGTEPWQWNVNNAAHFFLTAQKMYNDENL
jgi:predicted nucleotidyltransferase